MNRPFKWTFEELREHLNETTASLRRTAEAYDRGEYGASKDLAVKVQALVYDKGKNLSILTQIGRKNIEYHATRNVLAGKDVYPQFPLIRPTSYVEIITKQPELNQATIDYEPVFDEPHGNSVDPFIVSLDDPGWRYLKFSKWWEEEVLLWSKKRTFSRKNIILMHANREGGRHLASSYMNADEESLIRQTDLKCSISGGGLTAETKRGPQYACVRQIAYELQLSLDARLSDLLDSPATGPLKPKTSRFPGDKRLIVKHDRRYLEEVLASYEQAGEGNSPYAEEVRRKIYWET